MASLYKREGSPFWYLRAKKDGVWAGESTGLRVDSARDTKRARILAAERTFAEQSSDDAGGRGGAGWHWVPGFLQHRAPSEKTRGMYLLRWRHVARFLEDADACDPSLVRREHAEELVEWRMAQVRPASKKSPCRNTALLDLKLLKCLMAEAAARGMVAASPLAGIKMPRDEPAEKPEITPEEQSRIEAALASAPAWMLAAWRIAIATGCRLRETRIALRDADLEGGTIHFPHPKGGRGRAFTVPMPAALRPMFEAMRREGREFTLEFPFQPSRAWRAFFDGLGMMHLCFHCTRVTFISRLARAGAPLGVAMRLVNHSSELVHRLYRRTRADELAGWADRIAAPPACATPRNPRGKSTDRCAGSRPSGSKSKRTCK